MWHVHLPHQSLPSQVSNQCMALVRDDCLVPTLDAMELGYIRESTPKQYVPDVFYKVREFSFCCLELAPSSHCADQGGVWGGGDQASPTPATGIPHH